MTNICTAVFSKLNDEEIRYCHFKSNEHLEEGLIGDTDLDVLVDKKQYDSFVDVLLKFGFKKFEPNEFCKYPGVTNWYGYDVMTGALIHIHLHTSLITGKSLIKDYIIPWDNVILDNAEMHACGVKINTPGLELLLLFTRLVVKRTFKYRLKSKNKKVYFPEDEWNEVLYLRELVDEDKLIMYWQMLFDEKAPEVYINMMLSDIEIDLDVFKRFERYIRKTLKECRRMGALTATLMSFIYRARRKVYMKMNQYFDMILPVKKRMSQEGVLFAFVGIDGSGKSTMLNECRRWLSKEFDVKKYYLGSGDGNKSIVVRNAIKLYQAITRRGNSDDNISNMTKSTVEVKGIKSKIKALVASYIYLRIDKNNLRYLRQAQRFCRNGGIALCDRFPQADIEVMHDGMKVQRYKRAYENSLLIRRMAGKEKRIFKKIEEISGEFYVFQMNIDPEIAYKRKPENEIDDSERKMKANTLSGIEYGNIKRVLKINANENYDKVLLSIKQLLWEVL